MQTIYTYAVFFSYNRPKIIKIIIKRKNEGSNKMHDGRRRHRRRLGQEFLVGEVFPLVRTMMKPKEWLSNETFIIHWFGWIDRRGGGICITDLQ